MVISPRGLFVRFAHLLQQRHFSLVKVYFHGPSVPRCATGAMHPRNDERGECGFVMMGEGMADNVVLVDSVYLLPSSG